MASDADTRRLCVVPAIERCRPLRRLSAEEAIVYERLTDAQFRRLYREGTWSSLAFWLHPFHEEAVAARVGHMRSPLEDAGLVDLGEIEAEVRAAMARAQVVGGDAAGEAMRLAAQLAARVRAHARAVRQFGALPTAADGRTALNDSAELIQWLHGWQAAIEARLAQAGFAAQAETAGVHLHRAPGQAMPNLGGDGVGVAPRVVTTTWVPVTMTVTTPAVASMKGAAVLPVAGWEALVPAAATTSSALPAPAMAAAPMPASSARPAAAPASVVGGGEPAGAMTAAGRVDEGDGEEVVDVPVDPAVEALYAAGIISRPVGKGPMGRKAGTASAASAAGGVGGAGRAAVPGGGAAAVVAGGATMAGALPSPAEVMGERRTAATRRTARKAAGWRGGVNWGGLKSGAGRGMAAVGGGLGKVVAVGRQVRGVKLVLGALALAATIGTASVGLAVIVGPADECYAGEAMKDRYARGVVGGRCPPGPRWEARTLNRMAVRGRAAPYDAALEVTLIGGDYSYPVLASSPDGMWHQIGVMIGGRTNGAWVRAGFMTVPQRVER